MIATGVSAVIFFVCLFTLMFVSGIIQLKVMFDGVARQDIDAAVAPAAL